MYRGEKLKILISLSFYNQGPPYPVHTEPSLVVLNNGVSRQCSVCTRFLFFHFVYRTREY